jgi:hypothetical protein
MTNKECRNTRREIDELEMGQRPSLEATAHLVACSGCQAFQAERASLRELVGSLEPVLAPPDFDMRLRARIAAEKYDRRQQPFFARLISTPALAAAALFVVIAGSVYWISRRPVNPAVTPSKPAVAQNNSDSKGQPTAQESRTQEVAAPTDEGSIDVAVTPIKPHRSRAPKGGYSEDSLSLPTNVAYQNEDQALVPNRPVEFALQDESGKTRRISLPPVSFGAQNLVGNNRREVSYPQTSRVW